MVIVPSQLITVVTPSSSYGFPVCPKPLTFVFALAGARLKENNFCGTSTALAPLVMYGPTTAGAAVTRLGVRSLRIGAEIDPGVPWTYAEGAEAPLLLALKSGNFGARDFFLKAFEVLA